MRTHFGSYRTSPLLIALALMGCLAVAAVCAQDAVAERTVSPYEVRMAVDPTVLPPVENPDAPSAPLEEESVSVEVIEETEPSEAPPAAVLPYAPVQQPESSTVEVVPAPKSDPETTKSAVPAAKAGSAATPKTKPAPTGKGTIRKIALESTSRQFVITLSCDRPVGDISYLNLKNPSRFVFDLRQPWTYEARNVLRASSGKVKYVVTGKHPDRFRLVVHFRTPPKGRLVPNLHRKGNTLVITVPLR